MSATAQCSDEAKKRRKKFIIRTFFLLRFKRNCYLVFFVCVRIWSGAASSVVVKIFFSAFLRRTAHFKFPHWPRLEPSEMEKKEWYKNHKIISNRQVFHFFSFHFYFADEIISKRKSFMNNFPHNAHTMRPSLERAKMAVSVYQWRWRQRARH